MCLPLISIQPVSRLLPVIPSIPDLPMLFPQVFLILVDWKVTVKMAFLHHLLNFVISRPASETSLAVPAPDSLPEGADRNGICPAPSRFRYKPTHLRDLSRRPCPGFPSGRCRPKRNFPGTSRHVIYRHILFRTLSASIARHLAICLSGRR